ncbi:MAG: hypothetical protein KAJ52_06715 [Sedimentisphaerales bacterium]|nr:hypothetical protein [Sedimentisphaerales bacterium]
MHNQTDRRGQDGQPDAPGNADSSTPVDVVIKAFIAGLHEEERMLILLQKELYEGSWQEMLTDLNNRLEGRPYIFKLANRIRDDLSRIEKLWAFEREHNIKLADYVEPPSRRQVKG